jgi:hypothetical protein
MRMVGRQLQKALEGIPSADQSIGVALTALADSKELAELGRVLQRFNLFRVLRFEHGEIRHSNLLAWLFQPKESHGLEDRFLRTWLNRVLSDNDPEHPDGFGLDDLASWKIRRVEVEREWNHLDLLLQITTETHGPRVVAIENKLRARQSAGQLTRYRATVRKAFPEVPALFVFLTERNEEPEEAQYLPAHHAQVHAALADCLRESPPGDPEVKVLLRHYLAILEERNMGNPEIDKLVDDIYREHRLALDRIFQQWIGPELRLTEAVREVVQSEPGAISRLCDGNIVRFLPEAWSTPANLAGKAWAETDSAYVLCELPLGGRYPRFEVVIAGTDAEERTVRFKNWKAELVRACRALEIPIEIQQRDEEARWLRIYSVQCPLRLNHQSIEDHDRKAEEIWRWCEEEMGQEPFKRVSALVVRHLEHLPKG